MKTFCCSFYFTAKFIKNGTKCSTAAKCYNNCLLLLHFAHKWMIYTQTICTQVITFSCSLILFCTSFIYEQNITIITFCCTCYYILLTLGCQRDILYLYKLMFLENKGIWGNIITWIHDVFTPIPVFGLYSDNYLTPTTKSNIKK